MVSFCYLVLKGFALIVFSWNKFPVNFTIGFGIWVPVSWQIVKNQHQLSGVVCAQTKYVSIFSLEIDRRDDTP
jgi:hypothetical protein